MTAAGIDKSPFLCGLVMPECCFGQVAALVQLHNDYGSRFFLPGQQQASNGAILVNSESELLQTLQAFCKAAGLSGFKLPRRIFGQTEPLPVNASGKVLKSEVLALISAAQIGSDRRLSHRSRL